MREQRRRRQRKRTRDNRRPGTAIRLLGQQPSVDVPDGPSMQERESVGLLNLPDELLLMVMEYGGAGIAGRLACTCRRLLNLALDDNLWKRLCTLKDDPDMEHFVPHPHWDWRWLYRAHVYRPCATPDLVLGSAWYNRAGVSYAGEWANGRPHGYGRTTDCGDWGLFTRQGYWRYGRMHGYCIVQRNYQETCRGEFRHGKMHGTVRFTGEAGVVYEGEARRGEKHGTGTMRYIDGGHYRGQFRRGVRHGHGTLTWPDGRTETGQWEDDAIVPETVVHGHDASVFASRD